MYNVYSVLDYLYTSRIMFTRSIFQKKLPPAVEEGSMLHIKITLNAILILTRMQLFDLCPLKLSYYIYKAYFSKILASGVLRRKQVAHFERL